MFDMRCRDNGIEHRLTKGKHPGMNGQVERINRRIKEAAVKRFAHDGHHQFETTFFDFAPYNFRHLKTLGSLMPCERLCKRRTKEPERFRLDPLPQGPGLNT